MFKYAVFFALIAYASATVSSEDVHAEIKTLHSDVRADGYDYALDTTNHIHAAQSGDVHGNVHGDYEYVSPEGVHVKVTYVADEHGYQPSSDLLPTPPPVPQAILKALAYIEAHPQAQEEHHHVSPHQVASHHVSPHQVASHQVASHHVSSHHVAPHHPVPHNNPVPHHPVPHHPVPPHNVHGVAHSHHH